MSTAGHDSATRHTVQRRRTDASVSWLAQGTQALRECIATTPVRLPLMIRFFSSQRVFPKAMHGCRQTPCVEPPLQYRPALSCSPGSAHAVRRHAGPLQRTDHSFCEESKFNQCSVLVVVNQSTGQRSGKSLQRSSRFSFALASTLLLGSEGREQK